MKFPIKLNRSFWPGILTRILPAADDPRPLAGGGLAGAEFSRLVSTFKFGSTFKSTGPQRFPLSLAALAELPYPSRPVILDVGASDGSTSLDVIGRLPFKKYFVTDLNLEVQYVESGGSTYYYDSEGRCILAVDDAWVTYADSASAIFPFGRLAASRIGRAPRCQAAFPRIRLVSPALAGREREGVVVAGYNIFERWPFEKADLVLAANILNRGYFPAEAILAAVGNLLGALGAAGRLVVIDNRQVEQATIFQWSDGKIGIEKRINGGTEIEGLVKLRFGGWQEGTVK